MYTVEAYHNVMVSVACS